MVPWRKIGQEKTGKLILSLLHLVCLHLSAMVQPIGPWEEVAFLWFFGFFPLLRVNEMKCTYDLGT